MPCRRMGLTVWEILVVAIAITVIFLLVVALLPVNGHSPGGRDRLDCMNNVRMLVGLLEAANTAGYPPHSGPNLILYLVKTGDIFAREDYLEVLFCPGDKKESLELAGGAGAYDAVDLGSRKNGHLTSYAGRNQDDTSCRATGESADLILICDDSEDHHRGRGLMVGFGGGWVRWRSKVDDYRMDESAVLTLGPDSPIDELKCLVAD